MPQEKKSGFLESVAEINDMVKSEKMPEPTPHVKKCVDCCYGKICARV